MVPSVSLDDVQDKSKRKLMIDFIYKTTMNQATKEVWGDFKAQYSCLPKRHVEEQEKPVLFYYSVYNYCKFSTQNS